MSVDCVCISRSQVMMNAAQQRVDKSDELTEIAEQLTLFRNEASAISHPNTKQSRLLKRRRTYQSDSKTPDLSLAQFETVVAKLTNADTTIPLLAEDEVEQP